MLIFTVAKVSKNLNLISFLVFPWRGLHNQCWSFIWQTNADLRWKQQRRSFHLPTYQSGASSGLWKSPWACTHASRHGPAISTPRLFTCSEIAKISITWSICGRMWSEYSTCLQIWPVSKRLSYAGGYLSTAYSWHRRRISLITNKEQKDEETLLIYF